MALLFGWNFLIAYKTRVLRSVLLMLHLSLVIFVHEVVFGFLLLDLAIVHSGEVFRTDFLGAMNGHSCCTLAI